MAPLLLRHNTGRLADSATFEFWADASRSPRLTIVYACGTHRGDLARDLPVAKFLSSKRQHDDVARFCQGMTSGICAHFRRVVGHEVHPNIQAALEDRAIKFGKAILTSLTGGADVHFATRFADAIRAIPRCRITLETSPHRHT